ncbi:sel1 repeat family protein [Acaryochloris sp. CCMEE 5410]|nr:sel1 repeat family protein [Acaryochloris sp. CCMEE 5410]
MHPKLDAGQVAYTQHQYAAAFQLLSPLAYQGNVIAQCLLGSMFQLGLGVKRDSATAKQWYQQAGSQGCALSFHNLATIYEVDGQNPALAQYYRQKAKDMGRDLME